ncbi:uncharacterized protein HD556DRAFT_1444775 [Suillus plorans]|uniref:Uncharacterized protein n=1 Tax=Suillus plorans TaxID=116603 RepID=A0A9P7ALS8_9AGAM|nr:uncharacterized protein HD556DRAFT_1444775 [Suillus plorans]KAG1791988.1 hypothetical protein HD556DRAFT_1444775 [Suillus plorans]
MSKSSASSTVANGLSERTLKVDDERMDDKYYSTSSTSKGRTLGLNPTSVLQELEAGLVLRLREIGNKYTFPLITLFICLVHHLLFSGHHPFILHLKTSAPTAAAQEPTSMWLLTVSSVALLEYTPNEK